MWLFANRLQSQSTTRIYFGDNSGGHGLSNNTNSMINWLKSHLLSNVSYIGVV